LKDSKLDFESIDSKGGLRYKKVASRRITIGGNGDVPKSGIDSKVSNS
jgi:hypothetical protein